MKRKILTIAFAVLIPVMTAQAEGNTNEVQRLLNTQIGSPVFPQSNTLPQPSRRDVAGAVILNSEHENTVEINSVELEKE